MPEEIPVICVTYRSAGHVDAWLKSVNALANRDITPVPCIADNASDDQTASRIADAARRGEITLENVFWLPTNFGFNAAQNYAIRSLATRNRFKRFATLNHDAIAEPDWLFRLHQIADKASQCKNAKAGMFSGPIFVPGEPRLISSAGHTFRSRDGAVLDIDYKQPFGDHCLCKKESSFEPFSPCFAAALWSFEMIQDIGLPDSDQFMYYDDVEWAYRARIKDWSARFDESAYAKHPLPKGDKWIHRRLQRWRDRGRMAMVAKYFPEAERNRIFSSEPAFWSALIPDWQSVGDESQRRRVYDTWKDRYL